MARIPPLSHSTSQTFSPARARAIRKALAEWFMREQRDLPWRSERTVYRTVVSELMLQQTQVAVIVPAFIRWMEKFPDFATLAAAPEEEVLKAWEGLGYYRRARHLHQLARALTPLPDPLPEDPAFWRKLPGIGPYTAAAITSISFGQPEACVDGNVIRILARLTAEDTVFPSSGAAVKHFTPLAEALLDRKEPGRHNEAMMELGATVCHRRRPLCLVCPVRPFCHAGQNGQGEAFPRLTRESTIAQEKTLALHVTAEGILLHKSGSGEGRLAGLYEFPSWPSLAGNRSPSAQDLLDRRVRAITRYRITESLYRFNGKIPKNDPDLHCVSWDDLPRIAMSGPHRKWFQALQEKGVINPPPE